MTIDITDPWLVERSRALHAELDAAPTDESTTDAIISRHVADAMAARSMSPTDLEAHDDVLTGLYQASLTDDQPIHFKRMSTFMRLVAVPPEPLPPYEPDPSAPDVASDETKARLDRLFNLRVTP